MGSTCRACITKDQLIIAQSQIIDELRQKLANLTSGQPQHQEFDQTTSVATVVNQRSDGSYDLPNVSYIDLSSLSEVHGSLQFQLSQAQSSQSHSVQLQITPVQIVEQQHNVSESTSNQHENTTAAPSKIVTPRRSPVKSNSVAKTPVRSPPKMKANENQGERGEASSVEPVSSADIGFDCEESVQDIQADTVRTSNPEKMSHVLVLGTPHTRKIPLKCPVENCPHGDYKAWDRDLLKKHFERYHLDSHPNPVFNYLCPVDGCRYISYNEPSYGLYTHIKNVHRDYLAMVEQKLALADRDQSVIEERNLCEFKIDRLPSEVPRTPVRVLGTLSMEKEGLKCPLAVCQHGTTIFKSSSNKRLLDHFQRVHSFTHPHPEFIFICPVPGCKYESDVGNFRVYKHIKAVHKTFPVSAAKHLQQTTSDALQNDTDVPNPPLLPPVAESDLLAAIVVDQLDDPQSSETKVADLKTKIILRGSHNMVLDPLKCPNPDCPKTGFSATSTSVMHRHFKRYHRKTHPNPEFIFSCPVENCHFIGTKDPNQSIWRHMKNIHPEYLALTASLSQLTYTRNNSTGENCAEQELEAAIEEQLKKIRVEAVTDVLNPGTLVHPPQFRCLYPGCEKPPFSGTDKTQLLRHYANLHKDVDRGSPIQLLCPFQNCGFNCTWPAKPLFFHVESIHSTEKLGDILDVAGINLLDARRFPTSPSKDSTNAEVISTPIRIVGRPFTTGEFWCPIPGCGYSNGVLIQLRNHISEKHAATHPNPAYIYACPLQGCSFAKQNYYQALCTHMQREHGLKRAHFEIDEPIPKRKKSNREETLEISRSAKKNLRSDKTEKQVANEGGTRTRKPTSRVTQTPTRSIRPRRVKATHLSDVSIVEPDEMITDANSNGLPE